MIDTCPNAYSFKVSCNYMRLEYQSKVKIFGLEPDFNTEMSRGVNIGKMDFSKLMKLRNEFTAKTATYLQQKSV